MESLTFWLRPRFLLRVAGRFQTVAGFDRAIALASSALTAAVPLAIIVGAFAPHLGGKSTAERIIDRYDLTGGGADAVRDLLSPAGGTDTSLGILGFLFLIGAVLSFSRTVQRVFEQTWELTPLSVRNTLNGLLWAGGLAVYTGVSGLLHAWLGTGELELLPTLVLVPVSAVFLAWSGSVLAAHRVPVRDFVPFAVVGAVGLAIYTVGAQLYLPHLFNTYATRYGVIGAVFALISALFCVMFVCVAAATLGREVRIELDRIARGERPAKDQVRQEWRAMTEEARARWRTLRR
jgi:uncharacterized BrkB/YihY/UPF0761 family membrane protein